MRNFKPQFLPPNPQNSFQKSDRIYPESGFQNRQNEMKANIKLKNIKKIQQKMVIEKQIKSPYYTTTMKTSPIFNKSQIFKYQFQIQNQFPITDPFSQQTYFQPGCFWYKNLSKNTSNQLRTIQFFQMIYLISNWTGDNFPYCIHICVDGLSGFLDINGQITTRVITFKLDTMQTLIDTQGLRSYQLKYITNKSVKWDIPNQLTHLKFTLTTDDDPTPINLPLQNSMVIQFQIKNKDH